MADSQPNNKEGVVQEDHIVLDYVTHMECEICGIYTHVADFDRVENACCECLEEKDGE